MHEWASELAGPLGEISQGRFVGGLSDRMAELINGCARGDREGERPGEQGGGEPPRHAASLQRAGAPVRQGIAGSASGELGEAERWERVADLLADADEQVRRNLNLKQVLALLVIDGWRPANAATRSVQS